MEAKSCTNYTRTWVDGRKVCKLCGQDEYSHESNVVASYYQSSTNPVAQRITNIQEAEQAKAQAALEAAVAQHEIDLNPYWKAGMIVDGRDGNSSFVCEILQVNIGDETCDVKWACDGSITKRLPYCALSIRDRFD